MSRRTKPRWEQNGISPSKYHSPTRYGTSDEPREEEEKYDQEVWNQRISGLTNDQINIYLQSTSHLPKDIALEILRKHNYHIAPAMTQCCSLDSLPKLSLLEEKVLLSAAPIPVPALGIKNKPANLAERHVCSMLPHVKTPVIRDYFNKIGRDGFVPPRGWTPKIGHIHVPAVNRLIRMQCITVDDDSPLYEKPGKRVLRSSTLTPEVGGTVRRFGKRDNLAIAMVGYDQTKVGEDSSPEGRPRRSLPFRNNRSTSIESRFSAERKTRAYQPRRMDIQSNGVAKIKDQPITMDAQSNGILKIKDHPSVVREERSPSLAPSTSSTTTTSGRKKMRNKLEIDMNWSAAVNGVRMRRPSMTVMENGDIGRMRRAASVMESGESPQRKQKGGQGVAANGVEISPRVRTSAGADRTRRVREGSVMSDRSTRSSSVFGFALTTPEPNSLQSRKLRIDMVGWHQSSPRDKDGFVMPQLPPSRSINRSILPSPSPNRSPTRARQPTPSPPASPEI